MLLEICMSYISSAHFGNSNTVWTGIIAVILLSNSIGNYIGGIIPKEKINIYHNLISISVYIFFINLLADAVCIGILSFRLNDNLAAILSSLIILLPAEISLGMIPPQIMYLETENNDKKTTGIIYSLSTLGGLFGTLFGGFVLIPTFGVDKIVFICGAIILLLSLFGLPDKRLKKARYVAPVMLSIITIIIINGGNILERSSDVVEVVDSKYNRIIISYGEKNGQSTLNMVTASGFESCMYEEKGQEYELVFDYFKRVDEIISSEDMEKNEMLMIGGAAYQFPKYVLAHYPESHIDVVEIDEAVVELAEKYFKLQDCVNIYDPTDTRFHNYIEDAKVYVRDCNKKYDIVINDAFSGTEPVRSLTTKETVKEIKDILKTDGVYLINIIGSKEGDNSRFLKAEMKTLSTEFSCVIAIPAVTNSSESDIINFCVIATDRENLTISNTIDYSSGIILTDNFCPVDSMKINRNGR